MNDIAKTVRLLLFTLFFSSIPSAQAEPNRQELVDTIKLVCEQSEFFGQLDDLDPLCTDVYHKLVQGQEVAMQYLLDAYRALGDRCVSRLELIEEKVCEIAELNPFFNSVTLLQEQQEILCDKFVGTWTMLESFFSTNTLINFNNTFTALEELNETICQKFAGTWTILGCEQVMSITGPMIIAQSGRYCLTQNINSLGNAITIQADNVEIDLNNFMVNSSIIAINIASGHENIVIKDGQLISGGGNALNATNNANLLIDNVILRGDADIGLLNVQTVFFKNCIFTGENTTLVVQNAIFENCRFTENALSLSNSDCVAIKKCSFCQINNASTLLDISNSNDIIVENCNFDQNTDIDTVIEINNVQNIKFFNTVIQGNTSNASPARVVNVINNSRNIIFDTIDISNNSSLGGAAVFQVFRGSSAVNVLMNKVTINGNTGLDEVDVFRLESNSRELVFTNCTANDNNAGTGIVTYRFLGTNSNIFMNNCEACGNTSGATTHVGFELTTVNDATLKNCLVAQNFATSTDFSGFLCQSNTDTIKFVKCQAINNSTISSGNCFGFRILDSTTSNIICNDCVAAQNIGATDCAGFRAIGADRLFLHSCIADNNRGSGAVQGIRFDDADDSVIENSTASNNVSSAGGGDGIVGATCNRLLVKNCRSNDNRGAGADNTGFDTAALVNCIYQGNVSNNNQNNGFCIASTVNNCVFEGNICIGNGNSGFDNTGDFNLFKNNIANDNGLDGFDVNANGNNNCFVQNCAQANGNSGFNVVSSFNSFFNNKAQENGASGTSNWIGGNAPTSVIAVFSMNPVPGAFVSGPSTAFDNLDVRP